MLYKNLPESELRHVMRWRWFLDYLAAWKMLLLDRNVGEFKAVYRARRAFKAWRKDFSADREQIQQRRAEGTAMGMYAHSILWQYYVKGNHHFSKLVEK